MKAIDQVKGKVATLLRWAPAVTQHLERLAVIEDRLGPLDAELRTLKGPVPRAELVRRVQGWIQECGQKFRDGTRGKWAVDLATVVSPLGRLRADEVRVAGASNGPEDVWYLLCALIGPQLAAAVPAALAAFPDPGGLSVAERPAAIAARETERAALVAEHEGLVDQVLALSSGQVSPVHLPETQERRYRERKVREEGASGPTPGGTA
jgi:hypothetical protein